MLCTGVLCLHIRINSLSNLALADKFNSFAPTVVGVLISLSLSLPLHVHDLLTLSSLSSRSLG